MTAHIVASFDRDLEEVLSQTTAMGRLVLEQMRGAADSLMNLDRGAAEAIMTRDAEVNGYEVKIDAHIEGIFARRQPTARDLRYLIGMSRVSVDLERMGDEIRNIARCVRDLPGLDAAVSADRLTLQAAFDALGLMIEDVLGALRMSDAALARRVIEADRQVDEVYRRTVQSLIIHMSENSGSAAGAVALTWVAKSIERVGDHTKNVAESVIYISEGADVRHEFYTDPVSASDKAALS